MKVMDRKSATNLGSVIEINPASISKHYPYDEIEYIDISSVDTGFFSGSTRMPLAEAPSRAKRLVEHGDTILATVRPNLRSFLFIKNPPENMVVSTGFAVLHPSNKIDARFLYFTVTDQKFTDYLTANAKGSAYPAVDTETIARAEISFPTLEIQQKIAVILSTYDDLIENNLRRIKILEEMAQSLYREWFVKFRFPGHQKAKMINSPLGKIPEGWEVKPLESLIAEHIGGGWGNETPDRKHTEPAWVIRGTDIPDARRCNISTVPYRYHTLSNLRPRQLTAGDIIFEVSGGSKGQPLGRTLYISSELLSAFGGERVICASFCKRIRPDARLYSPEILYLSFLEAYDSGEIEQFQVQSTGISNFKWTEYIRQTHRGIPPDALQARFGELVNPLFSQIATLGLKNRNLYQTRDLLLPKLISGELDVSELDIAIPEANA